MTQAMNQIALNIAESAEPMTSFMLTDAPVVHAPLFPQPVEPQSGWAAANPMRAMALLYIAPTDGAMVEELLAA